jgi:hypothetical protein
MARLKQNTIEGARQHCCKIKTFKVGDLASILKCSIPNTRLKLKQWRVYTSYNQNGRFYTLPQVPVFNQHGIWRFREAAFSKHGNLKKTFIHLIISAPAGLSGKQIGELLGLLPQSFLHHFSNCPGICRKKHDGVYVYFSEDEFVYEKQVQQRRSIIYRSPLVTITAPEAIILLVAIIKHHGIGLQDILALPEIKQSKLQQLAIQNFMETQGLLKKTPGTGP